MHIQPSEIDAEISVAGDHLDRERFVDLHQVDVTDRQPSVGQRPAGRIDGAEAHDLGTERADPGGDDPRQRFQSQFSGPDLAQDDYGGGTVIERTAVTGRHRAVGSEDWVEGRNSLKRGARSWTVIPAYHVAVRQRDWSDLRLEDAVSDRFLGEVLGSHAEFILLEPGYAAERRDILSSLPHSDVDVRQLPVDTRIVPTIIAGRHRFTPPHSSQEQRIVRVRW